MAATQESGALLATIDSLQKTIQSLDEKVTANLPLEGRAQEVRLKEASSVDNLKVSLKEQYKSSDKSSRELYAAQRALDGGDIDKARAYIDKGEPL